MRPAASKARPNAKALDDATERHGQHRTTTPRQLAATVSGHKKRACIAAGPSCLVHSGGFEPPTARFVAEYSIQLSYAHSLFTLLLNKTLLLQVIKYGGRRRIRTSDRSVRSRVLYPAELCTHFIRTCETYFDSKRVYKVGGRRRIRTSDRSVRSRVLYPAELCSAYVKTVDINTQHLHTR